ncbi:MAG TPA: DMT family transporter [Gallionellaceae bacterium]|nr:DMT family transporter [Gallionellaceae bacterium]
MDVGSFIRLFSLAAIWGAAFLFTRIGAPALGPVILIEARVGLAALFLAAVALLMRRRLNVATNWKHYLILGGLNGALPFLLFAFAAQTLSASVLSVMNATAPIWGAAIGAVWARRQPDMRTLFGLLLGISGVAMVVGVDYAVTLHGAMLAIAAALLAPLSYGIATHYAKSAPVVDGFSNAHGSMWAASLMLLPALPFAGTAGNHGIGLVLAVLSLGIVCTGIAFLLYFRLVRDIGPTGALTVTFLIPAFGILWGHVFLGEPVSAGMIAGSGIIILGTVLVAGFNPAAIVRRLLRNGT